MPDTFIKTRIYELFPNKTMKAVLDGNCDYRRYCWNQALALWNDLYSAHTILDKTNSSPNWRLVRDLLNAEKADWQYNYSSRILNLAVQDLGCAWKFFFNGMKFNFGMPKFKTKRASKQGFKSDRIKLKGNKLILDKPWALKQKWYPIKLSENSLSYPTGVMNFYRENGHYFVAIPYKIPKNEFDTKNKTSKITGVDLNIGHIDYIDGVKQTLSNKLIRNYKQIRYYQRILAKKYIVNGKKQVLNSKKYLQTKAKLQATYQQTSNIQNDLIQKFTTQLVNDYDTIVIEDLNIKRMAMNHVVAKGIYRSMFGRFRQMLTYKCKWYNKKLIIADECYPSTQRCAICGFVKKGDDRITLMGNKKHHTRHNEFVCYNPFCPNYNKKINRDRNAVLNLTLLAEHPELNKAL